MPATPTTRLPCALLAAAASFAAGAAVAQLPAHEAYAPGRRVSETVQLLDAWEDGAAAGARPQDVLARTRLVTPASDVTRIDLVLFGDWGAHLESFDEDSRQLTGTERSATRTAWRAVDVDDDGTNEILLVRRQLEASLVLDAGGAPAAGDPMLLKGYAVTLSCLDRVDGALVERDIPADPASPAMRAVLALELGGPVDAGLQQAVGDWAFAKQDYEAARYRYQAVTEWAERALTAAAVERLAPGMPLPVEDPDDPVVLWLAAQWRRASLPPFYQRH